MTNTNCPNCGAVITGPKCEYCGTRFKSEEVAAIKEFADHIKITMDQEALVKSTIDAMRMFDMDCITPNEARRRIYV